MTTTAHFYVVKTGKPLGAAAIDETGQLHCTTPAAANFIATLQRSARIDAVTAVGYYAAGWSNGWRASAGTPVVVKGAKPSDAPKAAGLAVVARDTGRVLMLQRAHDPDDDAGGMWEFPGGRLEDGEAPLAAARREWSEETGCDCPDTEPVAQWRSGPYQGYVIVVPNEGGVDAFGERDAVTNPDDPDRDAIEALAWWKPKHLRDNPAVRAELADTLDEVLPLLKAAAKAAESRVPALVKVGRPHWMDQPRDPGGEDGGQWITALGAARDWAKEIQQAVQGYVATDPDDYATRSGLSRDLYNAAGVHLDDFDTGRYGYDDETPTDWATIASAVASYGDWTRWYPSREIRQSAYRLLGFEDPEGHGDIHIGHAGVSWGGEGKSATPSEWAQRDLHAYLLLAGLRDSPVQPTLWRGVDLHGQPLPAEFREGAVLQMPLSSFADDRDAVGRYGTDVTFMLSYARAIEGSEVAPATSTGFGDDEYDEDAEHPHEYVTGGHLRITRITKLTPPEVPDLPEMPDEDDFDDPDEYQEALDAYDAARERFYDLETDELLREFQPWTNDRYLIELEQDGVYDPDTREVVKGSPRRRVVPSYDWLFADPMVARPPAWIAAEKCLTCGCDQPHNEHGDPANITYEELAAAAEAAGISVEEAWDNAHHALHHERRHDTVTKRRRGHDGWQRQRRDPGGDGGGQWTEGFADGHSPGLFGPGAPAKSPVDLQRHQPATPSPMPATPAPAAPAAGRHGPDRDQIMAALASGEHHREPLQGGQVAKTQKVVFNDGTTLVHKTYFGRERPRAEVAASLVGQAVGAPVPTAILDPDNDEGVWMGFIDNADPAATYAIGTPMREVYRTPEALRLGLLDVLTFNADRHNGNWLILDDDQTPAGIDHGEAFSRETVVAVGPDGRDVPMHNLADMIEVESDGPFARLYTAPGDQPALRVDDNANPRGYRYRLISKAEHDALPQPAPRLEYLSRWIPNPLTPADVAQIRPALEGLRSQFQEMRRGYWWDDMMARFAQVAAHATGADQDDRARRIR